ncbi:hypothetical protein [Flavilitoribacter nigricans]|uniref:Uncharacterized protein n=1 Tax=Flavilitoribacter nigricans (strain ATCC 23147 / DSM 23189 / NBRC 102662 / NCIMB 1420 / SS-2) TaxID=1122177 RepID=A0A2D0MWD3_FLAN2|nr:hypothetical protein [Flavilitoribacter nigricans]PHN00592.1 hypothetical protein CRP01_41420 [Flavilitoribacter nigricans DSM 23189 = NBRC 102662]
MKSSAFLYPQKKAFTLLLLVLSMVGSIFSQDWELGSTKFPKGKGAPSLLLASANFRSPGGFRRIGGVDFQQVATPEVEFGSSVIEIIYNEKKPDGHRLIITLDNQKYNPYLADWQLKPVAEFAGSEYTSLVSLFGKRIDPSNSPIVYHPALINNLLGLRILQADMLLNDPYNYWRLPAKGGIEKTGLGESLPLSSNFTGPISQQEEYERIASMISFLINNAAADGNEFDSWIFTDYQEQVKFGIVCDTFYITGSPYFYFHKTDMTKYTDEIGAVLDEITQSNPQYDAKTDSVLKEITDYQQLCASYSDSLLVYSEMVNQIIEKYKGVSLKDRNLDEREIYIIGRRQDLEKNFTGLIDDLFDEIHGKQNAEILSQEELTNQLIQISPTNVQEELTFLMRNTFPELIQKINPAVYSAAVNTMRYAAFFRYVQRENPKNWETFLNEVEKISYQPSDIETPQYYLRPDNAPEGQE